MQGMKRPARLEVPRLRGRNGKNAIDIGLAAALIASRHLQTDAAAEGKAVVWIDRDGGIEVPERCGVIAELPIGVGPLRQRLRILRVPFQKGAAGFDDLRGWSGDLTAAALERSRRGLLRDGRWLRGRLPPAGETRERARDRETDGSEGALQPSPHRHLSPRAIQKLAATRISSRAVAFPCHSTPVRKPNRFGPLSIVQHRSARAYGLR